MELKRNIASKIPTLGLWLIVVFAIIFQITRLPELVIEDVPGRAATLVLGLIGLSLFAYLLEKVFPKKEVFFCKIDGSFLIIAPKGRKRFHWKFKIDDIDEVRLARKKYFGKELYIFLKNGLVKTLADNGDELDRLVVFFNESDRNISVKN